MDMPEQVPEQASEQQPSLAEKFQQLRATTDNAVAQLLNAAIADFAKPVEHWFTYIQKILQFQNEELSYLREMEGHARADSMTAELWNSLVQKLDGFRQRVQQENEAELQSAKEAAAP